MKLRKIGIWALTGAVALLILFAFLSRLEHEVAPELSPQQPDTHERPAAPPDEPPAAAPRPFPERPDASENALEGPRRDVRRESSLPQPSAREPSTKPPDAPPRHDALSKPRTTPPDPFETVDRILEKLDFGNIAFNAPHVINIDDTAIIQLLLGLATTTDELKQMIEAAGEKEGARIRVSDRMEARLSGPNFAITAITPEVQAVTRTDVTEWKWEVKPRSEGRQRLHLTLSVLINVEGASTPRAIRTFDKEIEIKVTWGNRVSSFFKSNWQWLWAAILVPVAGWLWKRKREPKPQ